MPAATKASGKLGGTASRPRSEESARKRYQAREERKSQRAARGEAPRIEEATSMEEALEAEREAGRREGAKAAGSASSATSSSSSSEKKPESKGPALSPLADIGSPMRIGVPLIFETVIIGADELTNKHRLPIPSRLLVAWAAFSVLGAFRGRASNVGPAIAWGLVVATFYSAVAPGNNALTAVGNFIGGKYGKSSFGKAPTATTAAADLSGGSEATAGGSPAPAMAPAGTGFTGPTGTPVAPITAPAGGSIA